MPITSPAYLQEVCGAILLTALICLFAQFCPRPFATIRRILDGAAHRRAAIIVGVALMPVAIRLALLPWFPPPQPHIHDEFSHLLVADTLTSGRLANPPHPLWRHLETIYELQQPTFSSIYPLGQGLILAAGTLVTGSPWAGVLLSVALMCGGICWMLYGCLPARWAALGGVLAALHFGLAPEWIDSYWGGALGAFGGALLFGALCRLKDAPSLALALLLGLGWSIEWLTRPFESIPLFLFLWICVAIFVWTSGERKRQWLSPVLAIVAVQALAGGVTAIHNRAVTGSPFTLPYQVSRQLYGVPQRFLWQAKVEEPALEFKELKRMYSAQLEVKQRVDRHPIANLLGNIIDAWRFFIDLWYTLPIALLVLLRKERPVMIGLGVVITGLVATGFYPFFFPHYIAAYACVMTFLVVKGMMTLVDWSYRRMPIGLIATLFLASGGLMMGMRIVPKSIEVSSRKQVADALTRHGGRNVVFVRYGSGHSFQDEWVYNAANIDASSIVWCRATDPADEAEVVQYYKGRNFWSAQVEKDMVRVSSYPTGSDLLVLRR